MSCVHYKFSSKLNYDTVTFDGLHISLCDLKRQIMGREKLKAADCDLQITNAQTKEGRPGGGRLLPRTPTPPGRPARAACPEPPSVPGGGGCWGVGCLPFLFENFLFSFKPSTID